MTGLLLDYYNNYIGGIVTTDFVCVFKVNENLLNKSQGGYAGKNKTKDGENPLENIDWIDEWCTEEYSIKNFKLIKVATKGYYNGLDKREEASLESGLCDSICWFVGVNRDIDYNLLLKIIQTYDTNKKMADAIATTLNLER